MDKKQAIAAGRTSLGIEFGSTRIKAVLIGEGGETLASSSHAWENRYENGIWTYSLADIWAGLRDCYSRLAGEVGRLYGETLKTVGAIGVSAMMHGYMAFDAAGELLVPFRTWRNTTTEQAARELTRAFQCNIPQRWSVAHLYQAVLNGEAHVGKIAYLTTLAGYIHWQLTGEKVLGVGDASGMFPIDSRAGDFDAGMVEEFDRLTASRGYAWKLKDILPKVMAAGEPAGTLTQQGAGRLDPSGSLRAGIPVCPPEGDAGTGMVATNSVAPRTGNVSAGTSVFAMIVLEEKLKKVHPEIDLVTTPAGAPVAMVHCNNCTSDLNAWVGLFREFAESFGVEVDMPKLFTVLYYKALEGDADCGGLLAYNYVSGESITGFDAGRPLFARTANSRFNLANFMRVHLFTALGALKNGLDILLKEEGVRVDRVCGHGGLFKTPAVVGQRMMAAAMNTPVSVMQTAGEGGAWGIAVLAAYMRGKGPGETLPAFLEEKVFCGQACSTESPDPADVAGFDVFLKRYNAGLPIERAAVEALQE